MTQPPETHIAFATLMDWLLFGQKPAAFVATHVAECAECTGRFRVVRQITAFSEGKYVPLQLPDGSAVARKPRSV
jgi:hypothetical protein